MQNNIIVWKYFWELSGYYTFQDIEIIFFLNKNIFLCAILSMYNIFRADNTILHEIYCISVDTNDVKRIR